FFYSLKNIPEISKWFETSPFAETWKSPEMASFVRQITAAVEAQLTQSKELGSAFNDLREICQGEVAVAIGDPSSLLNQSNAMEVPVAVLADVGSKKEKATEFLKKQVERLTTQGKLRKTEAEFRGERIILLEKEESDSKEKGPKAIFLSLADDLLALTLSKP